MSAEFIKCPNCGFEIEISEVLTAQIRENMKSEYEQNLKENELKVQHLKSELDKQQKQLEKEKANIESRLAAEFEKERQALKTQVRQDVAKTLSIEMEDLKNQLGERDKKIALFNKMELDLRKKMREVESTKENLELELNRKLDAEREKLKEAITKKITEERHLKDLEKEKIIQDLKKALEDAKRKAEQGSMQTQGEVLELDLEEVLKKRFPSDRIEPVPKGIRGADVVQKIFNGKGQACGVILWETKSTKNWSNSWVQKLKDDQRELGADLAVLVTEAMPKEIENFDVLDGIWVSTFHLAIGLATALRQNLIEISFAKLSSVGKNEKMEAIYHYLSGPEFRQKVEAIVDTFTRMQQQLDKEKRAMMKIWKEREKQIERITTNTIGMYGELKGIIGASLPELKSLELGPLDDLKMLEEN